MNLPIVIFDINSNQIKSHTFFISSSTFYFYSYQNFTAEIINGDGELYSVTKNEATQKLDITNGKKLSDNFGYTLYIKEHLTTVRLKLYNDNGDSSLFDITLKLDNILTDEQEHYNDLLINYYLPTLEELEPCLVPGTIKSDLLKRLLLDFRGILQSKGTTESIRKFFEFIGFVDEQFKIFEEYRRPNKTLTTKPDTTKDSKTGNYHVLYDNWNDENQNGKQDLNRKNMPYRPFSQQNLYEFLECLKYAIPIANRYFTCVEQDITFFGISHSVNMPMYQSITCLMNQIFDHDIYSFRKFIHIDMYYNYTTANKNKLPNYLVKNCLQKDKICYCSEVKHISKEEGFITNELHFIEKEIADGEEYTYDNIVKYNRDFGAILHLNIESPKTYVKVIIKNKELDLIQIVQNSVWVENVLHLEWCTTKNAKYDVIVEVSNQWNAIERYTYEYQMKYDSKLLDIDIFTSAEVDDKNLELNNINTDFDSGSVTYFANTALRNYILPFDTIPIDLINYWKITPEQLMKYLSETVVNKTKKLHILPELNKNIKVSLITDTIPVKHSCQTMNFIVIPYNEGDFLSLRTYNADGTYMQYYQDVEVPTGEYDIIDGKLVPITIIESQIKTDLIFWEIKRLTITNEFNVFEFDKTFESLYVRKMEVIEQQKDGSEIKKKYLFICPIETGIDMNKNTYDLYLNDSISIYDIPNVISYKLPVNYDFPLFPLNGDDFVFSTIRNEYPIVQSIIPRLANIKKTTEVLKLGDIIIARVNQDLICAETNIQWILENAFTHEVIFTTKDYMLKYRVDENTIYNIIFKCNINGEYIEVVKQGIITSYKHKENII